MSTLSDFITFRSPREREAVEKLLHKGLRRRIIWATRPEPRLHRCVNLPLWLVFGVYGSFFLACWTVGMVVQQEQPLQALFSLPFWLIVLGFLLHPYYIRWRMRRSVYLVAGVVAVIIEPGVFGWRRYSWLLKPYLLRAVHEEADGRGDLLFSHECYATCALSRDGWRGLADVRLAEERLSAALGQELPPRGALRGDAVAALTPAQRDTLKKVLLRGEHVCWVAQPRPCVEWRGNVRRMALGLPALVVSLVLAWVLLSPRVSISGPSAALPVLAGFALILFGLGAGDGLRPFWRRWQLARSLYVLTDRRALIIEPVPGAFRAHAFLLRPRMVLSRVEKKDGSGDLVFEEERGGHPNKDIRRGFLRLPDLRAAERELSKALIKRQAGN